MKQAIIWIIVILFAGGIAYTRFFKPESKLPDTSIYERRIDSLNNEIELHNKKIMQLDSLVDVQKARVLKLENKLGKTAAEAAKEHKQHEEDLKRISAMSNSDVAALFAESFK
jgi:predicted RNase H-like nuclease (RuvC/YqgF family)